MAQEISADVCYRHPTRESWTLCGRCGRTICPECQILTPQGVRCPDCVQETGGSVTWAPATPAKKPAPKRRPRAERVDRAPGEGWTGRLGQMLRPGSELPLITWSLVGLAVVLWIVNLVTGLPQQLLSFSAPFAVWEVWRFFTTSLVYPASFFLSVLLNGIFLLLTGPVVEQRLERRRTLVLVLAASALGSSSMVLAGLPPFGLSGVLFGMFGAYLIFVWSYPPARVQALVIIGINLLVVLFLGGILLPQIVGGLIAGAGSAYLYARYDERANANSRTPNLIIGGVTAAFILFAIIRLVVG